MLLRRLAALCLFSPLMAFAQGTGGNGVPGQSVGPVMVPGSQALYLPYQQGTNSATTITDYSGNALTGTFGTSTQAPSWLPSGAGILLGGTNVSTHISLPSAVLNGAKTIQMWFSLAMPSSTDATTQQWNVLVADSNLANIGVINSYNGQVVAEAQNLIGVRGTDRYINNAGGAWTFNGATMAAYINGRPVSGYLVPSGGATTVSWTASSAGAIGDAPGFFASGYSANFIFYGMAVYSTVLTPAQIAANDVAFKTQFTAATGVQFPNFQPSAVYLAQGDSRISNYGANAALTSSTPFQVFKKLNIDNYTNLGTNGIALTQVLSELPTVEYPLLDAATTSVKFIWNGAGINSIPGGGAATLTSLQSYCSSIHARYPGVKVLINTVPGRSDFNAAGETQREIFNSAVISDWVGGTLGCDGVADEANNPIIATQVTPNNFQPTAAGSYNSTYFFDGIHYTAAGDTTLANQDTCSVADVLGQMNQPCWVNLSVPFKVLSTFTGASQVLPILQLGPNWQVCGVKMQTTTAFAGTSITATTLSIGDSTGTSTQYLSSQSTFATGSQMTLSPSYVSTHGVVQGTFTSTGGNLSALTAGNVNIDVCVVDVP